MCRSTGWRAACSAHCSGTGGVRRGAVQAQTAWQPAGSASGAGSWSHARAWRASRWCALKPDELWHDGQPAAIVELPVGTDIWALHDSGFWVVVPTNTCKKKDGSAVMGAGLARDAALRYTDLAARYGESLTGGRAYLAVPERRLLLGPTKEDWRKPARMELVEKLLAKVKRWCDKNPNEAAAVPALGCGLGGLSYGFVRELAAQELATCRAVLVPPLEHMGEVSRSWLV